MNLNVIIFVIFLIANLVCGLIFSRNIKTIRGYAVGNRDFSTATIVATIVATWVSGDFFSLVISESYNYGLNFIWVGALGDFISLSLVAFVFAPRMGEFIGNLSIAEAMGDVYGNKVRVITAIAGFIGTCGIIALQLKIAGTIFSYVFDLSAGYGSILAGMIITIYSAFGGIKSVTFTDVIQFFTFGVIMPVILYFILSSIDDTGVIITTIKENKFFDYRHVFDFTNDVSLSHLFLFFFFFIPPFGPAYFQRIAMAKNVTQVVKSFFIASIICVFLVLLISYIAILILVTKPAMEGHEVVKYILSEYGGIYWGFKGILLAGVMAMVMSTVDSYINATSILVVHDFLKPLRIKLGNNELLLARIGSLLIGCLSILLSLNQSSLLELMILTYSFYIPVVTIPFTVAILGFRSSEKSILCAMSMGLLVVIIWHVYNIKVINVIAPAMVVNLITLFTVHYVFKQSGGWVGIKDMSSLTAIRQRRKQKWDDFISSIKTLNIVNICKQNTPKKDSTISLFGIFLMISNFSNMHIASTSVAKEYFHILHHVYPIIFFISTTLIAYPLWLSRWKHSNIVSIYWNIIIFITLICFSIFMILISNFDQMQLMIFMINILIMSTFMRWQWVLTLSLVGILSAYIIFNLVKIDVSSSASLLQFKIVYVLLFMSSIFVVFLKPKQEEQDLAMETLGHQRSKLAYQKKELSAALRLKHEFLRNLQHETNSPLTGIKSIVETCYARYDTLSKQQIKDCLENIMVSSTKLGSYIANITDLSRLVSMKYALKIEEVDLARLVHDRAKLCQKLCISAEDKDKYEFIFEMPKLVKIDCDKYYITQVIDNIIINAIQYSDGGKITIRAKEKDNNLLLTIEDEGIGVSHQDLNDIFEMFVVGSRTKTSAGGRGVGLALCHKVIDLHQGSIWARQNKDKGTSFCIKLPIKHEVSA